MQFAQIFPDKAIQYSFALGDANKILITNVETNETVEHTVSAYQGEQQNELVCVFPPMTGTFGTYENAELNYYNLKLVIRFGEQNPSIVLGSSSTTYGLNRDNSYMELVTIPVLDIDTYNFLNKQFEVGFNNCVNVAQFLSFVFAISNQHYQTLLDTIITKFKDSAPLPIKELSIPSFEGKSYFFKLVCEDNREPELGELLVHCLLQQNGHIVQIGKLDGLEKNADIYVLINQTEREVAIDEFGTKSIVIQVRSGIFSTPRQVIRKLQEIKEKATELNIKDRKDVMKEEFEKAKNESKGKCSGPKEDGGCCGGGCGGSKDAENESSGSKGKDESGCCSKDKNDSECCGGSKEKKDLGCGMGSDCCSINEDKPDCEIKKTEEKCGGSCGGECNSLDEDVKRLNIEQTGCCQGKSSGCCKQ